MRLIIQAPNKTIAFGALNFWLKCLYFDVLGLFAETMSSQTISINIV